MLCPQRSGGGALSPPDMSIKAFTNWRLWVTAPTDSNQGELAGEPIVAGPGPALPAEVATKIPASRAARKASESASSQGLLGPPPME